MKRVEVLIPFHMKATDTDHYPGEVIDISEEQLAKIRAIGVNMVLVLGDVEEPVADVEEPVAEVEESVAEKPKKTRKTKQ